MTYTKAAVTAVAIVGATRAAFVLHRAQFTASGYVMPPFCAGAWLTPDAVLTLLEADRVDDRTFTLYRCMPRLDRPGAGHTDDRGVGSHLRPSSRFAALWANPGHP